MGNLFDISGKVAVVTGGAGTLGSSISECLAENGVKVAVLGRDPVNVQKEAEKIEALGSSALPVSADVMDMDQLRKACELIRQQWGQIDILVNTAGGNIPGATIGSDQSIFDMNIGSGLSTFATHAGLMMIPFMNRGISTAMWICMP